MLVKPLRHPEKVRCGVIVVRLDKRPIASPVRRLMKGARLDVSRKPLLPPLDADNPDHPDFGGHFFGLRVKVALRPVELERDQGALAVRLPFRLRADAQTLSRIVGEVVAQALPDRLFAGRKPPLSRRVRRAQIHASSSRLKRRRPPGAHARTARPCSHSPPPARPARRGAPRAPQSPPASCPSSTSGATRARTSAPIAEARATPPADRIGVAPPSFARPASACCAYLSCGRRSSFPAPSTFVY